MAHRDEVRATRIYRVLLRAYPAAFRAAYEREMMLAFRDMWRDSPTHAVRFWRRVLLDIVRSVPSVQLDNSSMEVTMKIVGIIAILFGAFGMVNGVIEMMAAPSGAAHLASVGLGIGGGALLAAAGTLMLRQSTGESQRIMVALAISLAVVIAARLVQPWMSVISLIAGIALPVILLATQGMSRGRKRQAA